MKRLLLLGIAAAVVACQEAPTDPSSSPPSAGPRMTVLSPPGVNLLICASGTSTGGPEGGTCTLSADHKKATMFNNGPFNPAGDASAVWSEELTVYGEYLSNITELSYTYKSMTQPAQIPGLGNLLYEISIDTDGDTDRDFWAFIDASTCGGKTGATVNIVTMANCQIVAGDPVNVTYPNWAAFVSVYGNAKVENLHDFIMIISYRGPTQAAQIWQISNVKFGKTGLICFDGPKEGSAEGGLCTLGKDFLKSATLDNLDGSPPGYAGVFSRETTGYGLYLSAIKDLSFKYQGLNPPLAGQLRYEIPISENLDGSFSFTAVVDVATCLGKVGANGVGAVNITRDLACKVFDGTNTYDTWALFAAAHTTARTATDQSSTTRENWITLIARRSLPFIPGATRFIVSEIKWGAKL